MDIYDNIIFIIPPHTFKEVYSVIGDPKKEYEKIEVYKNNIFWSYSLKNVSKELNAIFYSCNLADEKEIDKLINEITNKINKIELVK